MPFDVEDLLQCLQFAWENGGRPLAHNWTNNPFSQHAISIRQWCAAQDPVIDWGAPAGFPVQQAQRAARGVQQPIVAGWQEPGGWNRIMFSFSEEHHAEAYAAAAQVAHANGFDPV